MNKTVETIGDATGKTGWRKTYARNWTPPAQPCGAWSDRGNKTRTDLQGLPTLATGMGSQTDRHSRALPTPIQAVGQAEQTTQQRSAGDALLQPLLDTTGGPMNPPPETVMQAALDAFGTQRQVDNCLEELGELAAALIQYRNGRISVDELRGEIADVQVIGGQMRLLYGAAEVDAIAAVKLRRLQKRIADQVQANAEKAKPVKPVLRWEDEGNALALYSGYKQIGMAEQHKSGRWIGDPFGMACASSDSKEGVMRHVERMCRLPEVPLWSPTLPKDKPCE